MQLSRSDVLASMGLVLRALTEGSLRNHIILLHFTTTGVIGRLLTLTIGNLLDHAGMVFVVHVKPQVQVFFSTQVT